MAHSVKNFKAPRLNRRVWGRKKWCHRICPYATNAVDTRIPDIEKSVHTTTSGAMELDIRRGHDGRGWVCTDPNCSFFLGTATTSISMSLRNFTITASGSYEPAFLTELITPCSGTRFFEM